MMGSEAGEIHLEICSVNPVLVKEGFIHNVLEGSLE